MTLTNTNRLLQSIGKKIFVDYFDEFKNHRLDKQTLAKRLLEDNSRATSLNGQLVRVNCAKRIFENNLQVEALRIVLDSNRLSDETLKKARALLQLETK